MTINCYDADCYLIGIVEDFINFRFERDFCGIGDFEIQLDGNNETEIGILSRAVFIKLRDGECGYITAMEERKTETEFTYTFSGVELKGIASKRMIQPPSGAEFWKITNRSPEYIIYRMLKDNLVEPTNTKRTIAGTFAPYTESETLITYETKYTVLSNELTKLAQAHEIGWYANIENHHIVWYITHGVDRTLGQHINEPLLLGFEFDMLQSLNYAITTQPVANMAFVLGDGQGANRPLVLVGDTITGLDRIEVYVDGRNSETSGLAELGEETIASYGNTTTVSVKPIYEARKYYGDIYNIGDYGTLIEQNLNLQLTHVRSIWEANQYKLEFTFGYNGNDFAGAMKRYTANFITVLQQDPIARS